MIIGEIGLNHCGDKEYANLYVDVICSSACDALTFQIREPSFYEREDKKHLKQNDDFYGHFCEKTKLANKQFGIALADPSKIEFFESIGIDFYKILSKDFKNSELVEKILRRTQKPLYFSTGMASDEDIKAFRESIGSDIKRVHLNYTQLNCEVNKANLNKITALKAIFGEQVAFGSHCENYRILYMALAYKPSALFLYVKGDRPETHPDDAHAVPLQDIMRVARDLKELPAALG